MQITMAVKDAFFDRAAVIKRMDAARVKALAKCGAFVRRTARTLVRRRKRTSRPREPPSTHSEEPNLRTVLFFYDHSSDSMVVGPVKLNQVEESWIDVKNTTVPAILEHGDRVTVHEWRFVNLAAKDDSWDQNASSQKFGLQWRRRDKRWKNASRKRRGRMLSNLGTQTRTRLVSIKARPFMGPALKANIPKFPETFRNSVIGP